MLVLLWNTSTLVQKIIFFDTSQHILELEKGGGVGEEGGGEVVIEIGSAHLSFRILKLNVEC